MRPRATDIVEALRAIAGHHHAVLKLLHPRVIHIELLSFTNHDLSGLVQLVILREVSIQARDALSTLLNSGLYMRFKFLYLSRQLSDLLSGHSELLLKLLPLVLIPLQLALDDLHVLAQQLLLRGQ